MRPSETTQILVRKVSGSLKARLRREAERNGRSMEEEARNILREGLAVRSRRRKKFGTWMSGFFKKAGLRKGEEIREIRGQWARPAIFDD
jgi:plasmid stability protein